MAAALGANAGPVKGDLVAADARWLFHLDLDALRASKIGAYLFKEVIDKRLADAPKLVQGTDLAALARKITAVTAYGGDYTKGAQTGVLLVDTDADTVKALEDLVLGEMERRPDSPIKRLQSQPFPIYQLKSDSVAGLPRRGLIVLAKNRAQVERAGEVANGAKANLKSAPKFQGLPEPPRGTVLSAMAESFQDVAGIPPQARVFQMADGARLALGEVGDKLCLNVSMKARTEEASQQMRQVVEGLVALVSLSDSTNQEVLGLVRGLRVTNAGHLFSMQLDYPVTDALRKIAERQGLPTP